MTNSDSNYQIGCSIKTDFSLTNKKNFLKMLVQIKDELVFLHKMQLVSNLFPILSTIQALALYFQVLVQISQCQLDFFYLSMTAITGNDQIHCLKMKSLVSFERL